MPACDYHVFISYSFKDTDDALWLRDVLAGAGLKSFLAIADLGADRRKDESWSERIVDIIGRCGIMVVLASPVSIQPTDLAFKEACDMHHPRPGAEEFCILSLGTGRFPTTDKHPRHWHLLNWLNEMLGIAMNGSSDLVHSTFSRMYQTMGLRHRYLRIDLDAEKTRGCQFRVDDTDPETLDELERIGDELAVEFDGKLEEFAGMVVGD